jgi:hypothetical protein
LDFQDARVRMNNKTASIIGQAAAVVVLVRVVKIQGLPVVAQKQHHFHLE